MAPMRVRVDLLPHMPAPDVAVIVDVLRASSAIALLLGRGASEVWVTASLRAARNLEGLKLGEREGLPPEGFHHGTDLKTLSKIEVEGRRIVYTSENLPRALAALRGTPRLFLGSFRNARALLAKLEGGTREVRLVASGHRGRVALDDTLAAGFLAKRLVRAGGEGEGDGFLLATRLLKAFPDPQEGLWQSEVGRWLAGLGFTEDLALATLISHDPVVPELVRQEEALGRPVYVFARAG